MSASEREVAEAAGVIRKILRSDDANIGTREICADKIRALEGICGGCRHLRIIRSGPKSVGLSCEKGNSPANLYSKTELGEVAYCPDFSPVKK